MSTRITNAKREAILEEEVSEKFHETKLKLHKEIIDFLDNEASKQVSKKVLKSGLVEEGYIKSCNEIRLVGKNRDEADKLGDQINTSRWSCRDVTIFNFYPCKKYQDVFEIKITKTLENKVKKYVVLKEEESEFKCELRAVLHAYSSSKQLLKAMPELSIHFENEINANALIPFDQIEKVRKSLVRSK